MLKAIIFDFDGVIAESVEVKIEAFRRLFAHYPQHLPEILTYHRINGGISRFVKFRYIYEKILHLSLSEAESQRLGELFSQYALEEVIRAPLVNGALEFLDKFAPQLRLFIVSGTPEDEMRMITDQRGLTPYFEAVYGSPRTKAALNRLILKENDLYPAQTIFVGDSINDYEGAHEAGVPFVGRVATEELNPFSHLSLELTIKDLTDLEPLLISRGLLPA